MTCRTDRGAKEDEPGNLKAALLSVMATDEQGRSAAASVTVTLVED